LKPKVEEISGERAGLCILSNLVDAKRVTAEIVLQGVDPKTAIGIQEASVFAFSDPYRAATHNKGVMNGIDSVLLATGNDWRAVSAGIHAYAARSGKYKPVTEWTFSGGALRGYIDIPLSVGTVGGATVANPLSRLCLKILGVKKAAELARICAAVGLVQNLAALKALATVGIVKGHMRLHSRNLAIAVGAKVHEIDEVTRHLRKILETERKVSLSHARDALVAVRKKSVS
jgi:hydroxymethylglutaryl-CoA reductase